MAGLAQHLAAPRWLRDVLAIGLVIAAVLMLVPAAHAALGDAEHLLEGLSTQGILPEGLAALHSRFGTPARAIDVAAAATILIILAGSGRVEWLGRAYAIAVAASVVAQSGDAPQIASQAHGAEAVQGCCEPAGRPPRDPAGRHRLRSDRWRERSCHDRDGGRPVHCCCRSARRVDGRCSRSARAMSSRRVVADNPATLDLLPAAELSLDHIDARVGNVLVPVRNPRSLDAPAFAALQAAGDRDVVVMTVRLVGVDVAEDARAPTPRRPPAEQRLLSDVVALAERQGRPVRLLIVPAHNVFDAIVSTILRLRSSEVHVGESATLSADEQARLLGEAWERADKPEPLDVRLVVYHRSGRTDVVSPRRAPAVAHRRRSRSDSPPLARRREGHRPARAPPRRRQGRADTNGTTTERPAARGGARAPCARSARPADELAAVLRARDFARLRDMVRNRHAGDLADAADRAAASRIRSSSSACCRARTRPTVFEYLVARRAGSAAQGDGAGGRRGAAQRHGAGRPHDVPRGAAGDGDAAAAALLTPEERVGRGHAARLSRRARSAG